MDGRLVKDTREMDLDLGSEKGDMVSKESPNSYSLLMCDETLDFYQEDFKFEDNEEVKDTHETWKPLFTEYVKELVGKEEFYHPKYHDMNNCPNEITVWMRAILIDSLQEFCFNKGLKRETFHQCVSHLDRILCINSSIDQDNFQLYGLVALYLSSKTEVTLN